MPPSESEPDDTTLEAVYNLNRHAKKYARLANENYQAGKKATARANSLKKRALYKVKTKVLNQYLPYVKQVERHRINGDVYACLYFRDSQGAEWSFHQPQNRIHRPWLPDNITLEAIEVEELEDFTSTEQKDRSDMSLKSALLTIEDLGFNVNEYLPETHVNYGRTSHFVGWTYLGEGE